MRPAVASIDDGTWNDISGAVHDISGFTSFVNHNTANAHFPLDIFSATYDSSGSTDQFEMPVTDVVNTGAEAEAYNGIDKSGENIGDMKSLDFSEPPVAVLLGVGVLLLKLVRRRKLLKAMEK
ncbi:MAG: hypothetical protein JW764_04245 [Chlorobiaceae bacterium]|nr:hypothetical protein [Chlorobiaceae bacterium]